VSKTDLHPCKKIPPNQSVLELRRRYVQNRRTHKQPTYYPAIRRGDNQRTEGRRWEARGWNREEEGEDGLSSQVTLLATAALFVENYDHNKHE